jgi:hypothetical protein
VINSTEISRRTETEAKFNRFREIDLTRGRGHNYLIKKGQKMANELLGPQKASIS